jgi:septum formation protein
MASEHKIVLASASPRRKELMQKHGLVFDVVVSDVDESKFAVDNITPQEYAKTLALAKAAYVAEDYPDSLVIGADTIADCDGKIIGKAENEQHAEFITRLLFSRPHRVITGVALVRPIDNIEIVDSDITIVYPRKMSDKQIAAHIKGGTWQGKAGAYAIQETGDEFVEKIDGSLTNVMGLPMELLDKLLSDIDLKYL